MTAVQTFEFENTVNLDESAHKKISELIEDEGDPNIKLRVFVTGGGCSGFQYGFAFEEEVQDDDIVMDKGGINLLVDQMSFQYLNGATIRFKDDLIGARFTIDNPNAETSCGCGNSFSV